MITSLPKRWRYATLFLITTFISFLSFQHFTSEETHSSLKDQHERYHGMSLDEINKIPKYDRPDLAIMQNFEMTQDPSLKDVPVSRTVKAFSDMRQASKSAKILDAIPGVSWTERGPDNVGGRTRAVMFDPNDATNRKVWAGSVGGGLWFNNDITSSSSQWQNIDDFWANIALTSIAYDPSNTQTFYVGTGEGYFNADAIRGAGIWKSTDGGANWSQLASTDNSDFHYIQKIAVTASGTVLAATRSGLFRSTNGGSSWSQPLSAGRYSDIEIASNGDIYVSLGIFSPGSVFKSTNDGVSFSDVTPQTGGERIELAIAPSDPQTVYAVASNNTDIAWFRKTTNGGSTWNNVTIPNYLSQSCTSSSQDFARGQAWYDLIMAVQPDNPNIVLVGGIDVHRSTNGGSSWSSVSYWTGSCRSFVHADQHAMAFRPGSPNAAIFGHDGGVSYSSNVGNSSATPSFSNRINNYNVTQFYAGDQVNSSGSNYLLAGAQDNGSQRINTPGLSSSVEVTGGDGAFCHVDQDNSNYQITSYVYNSYYRSTNGGNSFSSILSNQTYGRFINPTDYDDGANILYCGANEDQLIRISGITGSTNAQLLTVSLGTYRISTIKVSPYTNNRLFIGTGTSGSSGGSKIFRIDNANGTPTSVEISTASIPGNGYISSIDVGSSDNQLLVTLSNYGVVSVWETRNGGSSWTNREGNLPDIPIRWGLYNPSNTNEAILATELGVWSTDNINVGSPVWGSTNTGLANVRVDMLQYRDSDGQVVAATHGRGLFVAQPFSGGSSDTTPPTTPTGLVASNVTSTGFDVNWTASTDNVGVTNYSVSLDGSPSGTSASTSFSFTGLTASTTYEVSIVANDAAGNSSTAATLNVTTAAPGSISCSTTVSSYPYNEGFESGSSAGSWTQLTGDDGDWVNFTGSTPSSTTGPSSASEGTRYIYLEASTNGTAGQIGSNATAIIESPCFDLSGESSASFDFSYHMYGSNMGTLSVQASTDGVNYSEIFTRSGDQGNAWQSASLPMDAYIGTTVKLRIVGTTGGSWQSDLAVDGLSMTSGGSGGGSTIPCTTTVASFPYSESFESGAGTWVQATGDDGDWVNDANGTPSNGTGPSAAIDGSFYMFLEASTNSSPGQIGNNATAILESPCIDLSGQSSASFNYNYHMYGNNVGTLRVEVTTDGTNWTEIWSLSGNQGNAWQNGSLSLASYVGSTIKLRFRGTTGNGWSSDIAIDNISVSTGGAPIPALPASPEIGANLDPEAFIQVYPNPVVDYLRINMQGFAPAKYTVVSLTGRIIHSGIVVDEEVVDMSRLQDGYYLLRIDGEEEEIVEKILKR